jgi:N-acetyl-gamma-glutamyl-phosphate reductase
MTDTLRVAVVGASGYAGGELIRLLAGHPSVEIAAVHARGREGTTLAEVQPHLAPLGLTIADGDPAESATAGDVDVAFLALPHGASAPLAAALLGGGVTVIDIGADFRLHDPAAYATWYGAEHPHPELLDDAVYGLTEWSRERLAASRLIANPGCYPTAALLALTPIARCGVVADEVIVDAKSGISGAGRGAGADYLFTELTESTRAYGLSGHRHRPEIEQGLASAGASAAVTFVPHLVPQSRGIHATCYVALTEDLDDAALEQILRDAYDAEPFVHVSGSPPATKQVTGSNHAVVHARRVAERRAVVIAVIDNLGKGAAGQAVQNMNVALGLDETAGLAGLGLHP